MTRLIPLIQIRRWMASLTALLVALSLVTAHAADPTLVPLTSFMGDGWFAPAEGGYTYLGTANLERGLAFSPAALNGTAVHHLYLVSRNAGTFVRVLNAQTGAEVGSLNMTGVNSGAFFLNYVGVGGDGIIYGANLTTNASTSNFRIYKWTNESAVPSLFFNSPLAAFRAGDDFEVFGSGAATRFASGFGSAAGAPAFAFIDGAGVGSSVSVSGVAIGDYRLGLTFVDPNTLIGSQGTASRVTSYSSGTTGTLVGTNAVGANERAMDFATIGGKPWLATIDTASSLVRVYDMTVLTAPVHQHYRHTDREWKRHRLCRLGCGDGDDRHALCHEHEPGDPSVHV
jgi:Domain of unknown function (DUF4623)